MAKSTKTLDHIHTLQRVARKGKKAGESKTIQWRCAHPKCWFICDDELVKGKASMCNKCRLEELIMTPQNRQRVKPVCIHCSTSAPARAASQQYKENTALENILKGIEFKNVNT